MTLPCGQSLPSGQGVPVVTRDAASVVRNDLPSPGRPTSKVIRPKGIRPAHSQDTGRGSTSARHVNTGPGTTTAAGVHSGAASARRSNSARTSVGSRASGCCSIQLLTSPLGGRAGSSTIRTDDAMPWSDWATCWAWLRPASSLSHSTMAGRPRKCSACSAVHLPAPPALHVANTPAGPGCRNPFHLRPPMRDSSARPVVRGKRYGTTRVPSRSTSSPLAVGPTLAKILRLEAHDLKQTLPNSSW